MGTPPRPHPRHSPTLAAPGPEGPPASCLMASLLPAQTSLLPGQPHHGPASGAPSPPPSRSWHMEPCVCLAPCSLLARQLGRRQSKGLLLCCASSRETSEGLPVVLVLGFSAGKRGEEGEGQRQGLWSGWRGWWRRGASGRKFVNSQADSGECITQEGTGLSFPVL